MSEKNETPESTESPSKPTAEQSFAAIAQKAKAFLESAKLTLNEYYETYFGSNKEAAETELQQAAHNHHEMHSDSRRRMGRSVNAITSKPVSSTRGNPTREKKKVVVSKTYKPELDRF